MDPSYTLHVVVIPLLTSLSCKELTRSDQQPLPAPWHDAPSLLLCMWPCWHRRCQGSWQMLAPSPWPTEDFLCVCVCVFVLGKGWLWLWHKTLGLLFLATINTSAVLWDNALAFNRGIWMPGEDDWSLVSSVAWRWSGLTNDPGKSVNKNMVTKLKPPLHV